MNRLRFILIFLFLTALCLVLTGRAWAGDDDELLGEANLKNLQKICRDRRKAYEGVPWGSAQTHPIEVNGRKVFDMKCNSTKKVVKHYCKLLKRLYLKYCDVFKAFKPSAIPCKIFIYRNYTEFRQQTRVSVGVGGFYQPGRHALYAFHGVLGSMNSDAVLAHEGCHLFQDLFLARFNFAPTWLVEGMAVIMEAAKIGKDGKIHIRGVAPGRLANLQSKIEANAAIPLSQVINTPRSGFTADHYAHAGMFTYWLIKGSKKKSLAYLYNDYLRIAARDGSRRAIRRGDFGTICRKYKTTIEKLEKRWTKWVMKQKIERPGKVVGDKFVCDKYGFFISTPGPGWKIGRKKLFGRELFAMTHKDIKGRITVTVSGTGGTLDVNEYLSMLDQWRQRDIHKYQNYRRIKREVIKKMGLDGYDAISEYAYTEDPITKELQRRRTVAVSMVDIYYRISCRADPDKFDALQEHFDKVVASFRLDATKLD